MVLSVHVETYLKVMHHASISKNPAKSARKDGHENTPAALLLELVFIHIMCPSAGIPGHYYCEIIVSSHCDTLYHEQDGHCSWNKQLRAAVSNDMTFLTF